MYIPLIPAAFRVEKQEKKKEKAQKSAPVAAQIDEDGDVEEVSDEGEDGEERSRGQTKSGSPQYDGENEDCVITVNNDLGSDSSPEVVDSGD